MSVVPRVKRCESEIHGELTSVRRRRREVGRSLENENHILMRMHSKCIYTNRLKRQWHLYSYLAVTLLSRHFHVSPHYVTPNSPRSQDHRHRTCFPPGHGASLRPPEAKNRTAYLANQCAQAILLLPLSPLSPASTLLSLKMPPRSSYFITSRYIIP